MACVEIERQISFFSFGFARVTEVRHWYFRNDSTRPSGQVNWKSTCPEAEFTRHGRVDEC